MKFDRYKLFLIGFVTFLYAIVLLWKNSYYPLYMDDCLTQLTPFLLSKNLGFNLTGYNTYFFLGASDLAVSTFYFGSNLLVCLLRPILRLMDGYAFFFLNYIATIISIFTFDLWLSRRVKDYTAKTISIMVVIFSGWFIGLFKYHFISVLWILPLILYAVDKYLETDNGIVFSLIIGFMGIMNYYFLIISTPLIFLYTLFSELYFYKESSIKKVLFKALKYFGYFLLGIGLSSFVFIPSILSILKMPRSGTVPIKTFLNIKEIFRLISGAIIPINAANDHNFLISSTKFRESWLTYGGGPLIYSLLITIFVIPLSWKKMEKKWMIVSLYLFLAFLTLCKRLYPLLNATWDSRWMLMIVIFNAYFVGLSLNNKVEFKKKSVSLVGLTIIFLIILCFVLSNKYSLYTEGTLKIILFILCLQIIIVILYILFINDRKKMLLIVCFEAIFSFLMPFSFMSYKGHSSNLIDKNIYYETYSVAKEISKFLSERDGGFYRVSEMFEDVDCSNNGLAYGYRSFTLYSSLYNVNIENYANGRFKGYGQWHFTPNIGLIELKNMLGSKYLITHKNTIAIPYGYELIGEINNNRIYENKYPISLGYAVDNTLSMQTYNGLSEFEKTRALINFVITDDGENNYSDDNLKLIAENQFGDTPIDVSGLGEGMIYIKENTEYNMLFSRKYELYDGNNLVESHEMYTDYPLELYIPDNITTVYLFNSTEDDIGYNITYDVYFNDMSDYENKIKNIKDEELTNIILKNNKIEGDIKLNDKKMVIITLAYDEGFKAYDNGCETGIYNVNGGLIGLNLEKGEHHIVLEYQTKGLKEGFGITFGSLLILLIVFFQRKEQ